MPSNFPTRKTDLRTRSGRDTNQRRILREKRLAFVHDHKDLSVDEIEDLMTKAKLYSKNTVTIDRHRMIRRALQKP